MSINHYQVYNRRQQGLAETSRLILEFAGASYENVFVEVIPLLNLHLASKSDCQGLGSRKGLHPTTTATSASCNEGGWRMGKLQSHSIIALSHSRLQQEQISESHTMERFLSVTLGLMGTTPLEMARMDMYHAAWTDMMSMFMWKVWRAPTDELKCQGASDFWVEFPKFLKKHDLILKSAKGPFYSGSRVSLYSLMLHSLVEYFADLSDSNYSHPFLTYTHSLGSTALSPNGFHRHLT